MTGSVRTLLMALALAGMPVLAAGEPPAMPDQVPELMQRAVLPVTNDVPTCAAVADRAAGESDYLVVGLANGTVNIFHPSGSDMIVRVFELDRRRAVDDVCAARMAGARTDFAVFALQGRTLSVMGEDVSQIKGALTLPSPSGGYAFVRVTPSRSGEGPSAGERVLIHDEHTVSEVHVSAGAHRWTLTLTTVFSDPSGVAVHSLSDRVVLVTGGGEIHEFTPDDGLVEPGSAAAGRPMVVGRALSGAGERLEILSRRAEGEWAARSVALEDSLTLAVTVRDSLLLLGGNATRDTLRNVGWLALVDASGDVVARSDHGSPVAAAALVGEWLAVQGNRRNLSLYDMRLVPIWDNASQVAPLALLVADLNADDSEDLVLVGMREFGVDTVGVAAIRDVLDRPGFMSGAVVRGQRMYLDRPMLNVYYSHAGELARIVRDRRQLGAEFRRYREHVEAARHILTARAAAAALGHRDEAESLREEGAGLLAMPRRERATFTAAALLLAAGLWSAVVSLRRDPGRRESADVWVPCLLIAAGAAVWWLLGRVIWSPGLLAGAVFAGAGAYTAWIRQASEPVIVRVPGAPIEELELRIGEFTHGGDESSQQGRKKLTTLAYLIREMLDGADDPERYEMLRERLALRYKSFYPAKYQLARELPRHARAAGVAVEEAETIARAATDLHAAMTVCLELPIAGGGRDDERLPALADALAAREALRRAADDAQLIVRRNPGCSVTSCIGRVLDERREVLEETGVEVVTDPGLTISGDAVAIHRVSLQFVVENLVTNALRAMDDSDARKLSFVGLAGPSVYELRVTDTGCGIEAGALREIFIPRETDSITGGRGLPHSRELLRRVGGNIVVERTAAGAGTTFLVTLRFWSAFGPDTQGRAK